MKSKYLNRILSVFLTGSLILGMVACGNQNEVNNSVESESWTSESQVTTETQSTEIDSTDLTYPLETDVKLDVWSKRFDTVSSAYSDYTESPYHIGLQENTGVEVTWAYPAPGADQNQAYNLLLTEDVLPDVIVAEPSIGDATILMDEGVIYDLSEYIPKYAPDYWAFLNKPGNEILLKSSTTDDGRMFGVGAYREEEFNVTFIGPVIRQDWLEECNLEMPVTLEEWEDVLVTFKDKYNAKLGFAKSRWNVGIASGTGAFAGLSSTLYVDNDGKIQLGNVQPEWKESLEVLNKWYEMGLIDQDSLTMNDAAMRTKVVNNEIGVSITAMSQLSNWIADAEAQNTGAVWVGMEYPREAAGVATSRVQSENLAWTGFAMITTSCSEEEMITALKWLNYGFSEEGLMYKNFGTEGVTYTLDANGDPQWTDVITGNSGGITEALKKYTATWQAPVASVQLAHHVKIKNNETAVDAVYKWIENSDTAKHLVPPLALTSEESVIYSDKMNAINTRVDEMALKFLTGDESLDNFDSFVEEIYAMGLQECLDIQQAAYARFMER